MCKVNLSKYCLGAWTYLMYINFEEWRENPQHVLVSCTVLEQKHLITSKDPVLIAANLTLSIKSKGTPGEDGILLQYFHY